MKSSDIDSKIDLVNKFSDNPEALYNHLSDNVSGLHSAAPNISQSLNSFAGKSIKFLGSKIQRPAQKLYLSHDHQISQSNKNKFKSYYDIVHDPASAIDHVSSGTLNGEHMEALSAVHPELLQEMRQKILSKMDQNKAKSLPYPVKMSLAKFLGQPLDENMVPQSVLANQQALAAPSLSQQNAPKQSKSVSPSSGMGKLNIAKRTATRTDQEDGVT